ncbi:MAG: tetratricopeptide repeat protein [Myxococcota bacterium]
MLERVARILLALLFGIRTRPQEELTEAQLERYQEALVKGELRSQDAFRLLERQSENGDRRAVEATLDYMAALGHETEPVVRVAAEFFLAERHYEEAQRYAEKLVYDHSRTPSNLKLLSKTDVLQGDYVSALSHFEELELDGARDRDALEFQLDAMVRSGAFGSALALAERHDLRPEMRSFLEHRSRGRPFPRFSWHGRPSRSGDIFEGHAVSDMRRFMAGVLREPLQHPVPDIQTLDLVINQGVYIPDPSRHQMPEGWAHPVNFELSMTGDSEDFALWAWSNLCRLGYPARFVLGGRYKGEMNHAWVTLHHAHIVDVLECTPLGYNPTIRAPQAIEYRPMWSVDRSLHWYCH